MIVYSDSGNLVLPRELTLDNCQISHAGKDSEIAQLHADVHALDLAGNLLREWREVLAEKLCILIALFHLCISTILDNKMKMSTSTSRVHLSSFCGPVLWKCTLAIKMLNRFSTFRKLVSFRIILVISEHFQYVIDFEYASTKLHFSV